MAITCCGRCFWHRQDGQTPEYDGTSSDSTQKIVALEGVAAKENHCTETSTETRSSGGWKTTPFIIGNELGERLAGFGLTINLITFLTLEMHIPMVKAANIITNFGGASGLTPLLGAFIADAYLGRFKTIAIASFISLLGLVLLTISAISPALLPQSCSYHLAMAGSCKEPTSKQLLYFHTALFLLAVGTGGIKPNTAALGADQFNPLDPREKNQLWHFFNWYYFSVGLSILGALTVIVYLQDDVGWAWGFGIPTAAMALGLLSFFLGSAFYRHMRPAGSPFTRIAQVVVAAFRKRRLAVPSATSLLHTKDGKAGSVGGYTTIVELHHTDQFRFLDKAAIEEGDNISSPESRWRLCTVHQVEEVKTLLRMAPIWASTILVATVIVQEHTFSVQQARTMDRYMGNLQIPAASFGVFGVLMLLTWIPIYDLLIMRWLKKVTGNARGITSLQRVGIGLFIATLAMITAAVVEVKRRNAAHLHGLLDKPDVMIPISAFWLVPQHCLFGLADAFVMIGELEFFYDQSPESMRSTGTAFLWSTFAIGNYISTFLVTTISESTDWLQNNLNRAHLENFYWFLAVLSAFNFIFFLLSAHWFRYKNTEAGDEGLESDL